MKLFGGIEAGGTKFVCMVGADADNLVKEERFPTTTPRETIHKVTEFFLPYAKSGELTAVGIASFGPLDLNPDSPTYGYITTTPKAGWKQTDLYGEIHRRLQVPVAFDTDVNAAAFGEQYWMPENRSLDPFLYMTVGTGIGVGVIINGAPLHGLMHAEAGHFALPHDWQRDPFAGVCPYHGDCLEGLASGRAIEARWGRSPAELEGDDAVWELEAGYLALGLICVICVLSSERIVIGGGVMKQPGLLSLVQRRVTGLMNGYLGTKAVGEEIAGYITLPALGSKAGVLGAIALAETA